MSTATLTHSRVKIVNHVERHHGHGRNAAGAVGPHLRPGPHGQGDESTPRRNSENQSPSHAGPNRLALPFPRPGRWRGPSGPTVRRTPTHDRQPLVERGAAGMIAKNKAGWRRGNLKAIETPLPADKQPKPHWKGPMPATQAKIAQVALEMAAGSTQAQIQEALGISERQITAWRFRHGKLWHEQRQKAIAAAVETVRATAGTDAMLADFDRYVVMASHAEAWTRLHGEKLFPAKSPELTLPRLFEEHYRPKRLFDASPGSIDLYRCVLKRWQLLTGDPPLSAITDDLLCRYRNALMKIRGNDPHRPASPETVRSALKQIQRLLDFAGPRGRYNRDALGLLAVAPWAKPPKSRPKLPQRVTDEQLSRVYRAADTMTWPRLPDVEAPAWWRALLVLAYNTGLRRRTLFELEMTERRLEGLPTGHSGRALQIGAADDTPLERDGHAAPGGDPWEAGAGIHSRFRHVMVSPGLPPVAVESRHPRGRTLRPPPNPKGHGHGDVGEQPRGGAIRPGAHVRRCYAQALR